MYFKNMKKIATLLFSLLLFANCENAPKTVEKQPEILTMADTVKYNPTNIISKGDEIAESERVETDITIKEFGDEFVFHWKGIDRTRSFQDKNGICMIKRLSDKKVIAKDSLAIPSDFSLEMEADYNKDGVNDALIYAGSGANGGNSTYNLYISDIPNKTFHLIKNFEEMPNPEADTSGMIIYNAVYGENTGSHFYKIMPNYSIKEINNGVETQRFYGESPEDIKQEKKDEKAYRKAYNKAWAAFKKM
jgi:hypothetical protein